MIEYLKKYKWEDVKSTLYTLEDVDGGYSVWRWNPPPEMQYCSMLPDDTIIFFRSELDRMELDNRDVDSNREYITKRIEQLAGAAYND
jgi:hypothetical protein